MSLAQYFVYGIHLCCHLVIGGHCPSVATSYMQWFKFKLVKIKYNENLKSSVALVPFQVLTSLKDW